MDDASANEGHDFAMNGYNIRLEDLEVYFHEAKNTRVIDVEVQLGGIFSVRDDEYRQYTFECRQRK